MKNEMNIFEIAVRGKMRFPFKGLISVEDLWDLGVKELDLIFKTLNSKLKQVKEESLLDAKTQQDEELSIKIEIVKYIFETKQQENLARLKAKEVKEKKQKIMELIAKKDNESMENMSKEELTNMLKDMDN